MSNELTRLKKQRRLSNRRGVFTVEFAIVSSLFFVVLFGCFEFSRMYFVRHSMDQAAYEGARVGIIQGNSASDVQSKTAAMLAATGVKATSIDVMPTNFNELTTEVTVTITANIAANSWIPPRFFTTPTIQAKITLDHENKSYLLRKDSGDEVGDNDHEPIDI